MSRKQGMVSQTSWEMAFLNSHLVPVLFRVLYLKWKSGIPLFPPCGKVVFITVTNLHCSIMSSLLKYLFGKLAPIVKIIMSCHSDLDLPSSYCVETATISRIIRCHHLQLWSRILFRYRKICFPISQINKWGVILEDKISHICRYPCKPTYRKTIWDQTGE